jgi:hypothetical protein
MSYADFHQTAATPRDMKCNMAGGLKSFKLAFAARLRKN